MKGTAFRPQLGKRFLDNGALPAGSATTAKLDGRWQNAGRDVPRNRADVDVERLGDLGARDERF
jgi:hypothetical protein